MISSLNGAELITQASLIMEMEITVDEVVKTIYGHPTYPRLSSRRLLMLGEAVHIPKKKKVMEECLQLNISTDTIS